MSFSLQQIAEKYNVDLLILFGSQAGDKKNQLSDIDIAFYRKKPLTADEENNIWQDLMAFYKREDIDLINIATHPNALLRYQIFMQGKPLYEKISGLFETMKWQAYIDFEDFKRFYTQKSDLLDQHLYQLENR